MCHVVFWLPESSSRASHKLKHKFSSDTAKLIETAEGSKIILERVLPKELIPRVRKLQDGSAIADMYDSVTIIFAKIIGLHEMFDTLPTVQVVDVIDRLYRQIDGLIDEDHSRIEKIKTVGDTYMAGAGLPTPTKTHGVDMTYFAFAFAKQIMKFNQHYHLGEPGKAPKLDYKIGISSGKIVAGVIGRKNPVYDTFGDAVNTASRMYSFGMKHHVQTTIETINLIKHEFEWKSRGMVKVKGKGMMECFFVLGPKDPNKTTFDGDINFVLEEVEGNEETKNGGNNGGNNSGSGDGDDSGGGGGGVKTNVIRRKRKQSVHVKKPRTTGTGEYTPLDLLHMDPDKLLETLLDNNEVFESTENREKAKNKKLGLDALHVNKKQWTSDAHSKFCTEETCQKPFTLTFRRHHCRFCGRLLCNDCTSQRLEKQRICNQCMDTFEAQIDSGKAEWMKQAKEKNEQDEHKQASVQFTSPFRGFISMYTDGNARLKELNVNYQRDRVTENKQRQLTIWFIFLTVIIGFFHVMNSIILPSRCSRSVVYDNTSIKRPYSLTDSACNSDKHGCGEGTVEGCNVVEEIRKSKSNSIIVPYENNGYRVNMTLTRAIDDENLQAASLLTGLGFYPLIILYVFISQRTYSRALYTMGAVLLSIGMTILLVLSLKYSLMYGYSLCLMLLIVQITSPMEMALSMSMTLLMWSLYLVSFTVLVQTYPDKYSLTDFLNHALEKQTPIVVIAWFAGELFNILVIFLFF